MNQKSGCSDYHHYHIPADLDFFITFLDSQTFVIFVVGEILSSFVSWLFATTFLVLLFLPKVSYILFNDN